ncbi:MAG: hypothetical protein HYS69_11350 [candidate division NC10 bacterium]|nr:hypothetical protein [candidate division NC10 bacterium]
MLPKRSVVGGLIVGMSQLYSCTMDRRTHARPENRRYARIGPRPARLSIFGRRG